MYRTEQHRIYPKHPLYQWCDQVCHDATNLRNATRFRQRNILTGLPKAPEQRHPLEREVIDELERAIPLMNKASKEYLLRRWDAADGEPPAFDDIPDKYSMPTSDKPYVSYDLLVGMFTHSNNPDYATDALGANACQKLIRLSCKDMKSFYESIKDYQLHPDKYSGKPKLPGYWRKGSASTAVFTSDGTHYNEHVDEKRQTTHYSLTLPKAPVPLELGERRPQGRIKEIRIVPCHGHFIIHLCTDDGFQLPATASESRRIAAIDLGVDNLAAIVNNCGLPCQLYKGGVLKSDNQWYNKEMARMQSGQTKGGDKSFVVDEDAERVIVRREDRVRDFLLKASKRIVDWCVEERIDTLVVGLNRGWKDSVELGKRNNQSFVMIPHSRFISMLEWRCERAGVIFITSEESYTSKASFLDGDHIPTYGDAKPDGGWTFSGYRSPEMEYYCRGDEGELVPYKVHPRGLYKSHKHGMVNSDLNGAANTLRKVFPDAFTRPRCEVPDFSKVVVITHPDEVFDTANQEKQKKSNTSVPSRSKTCRLRRKGKIGNVVPLG